MTVFFSCCYSVTQLCPTLCDPMGSAAHQTSLSFTIACSLLKFMSIESVMPSSHLILHHPLIILPLNFPIIRGFPVIQVLHQVAKVLEFILFFFFFSVSHYIFSQPIGTLSVGVKKLISCCVLCSVLVAVSAEGFPSLVLGPIFRGFVLFHFSQILSSIF